VLQEPSPGCAEEKGKPCNVLGVQV
jgi:hypothetical protein